MSSLKSADLASRFEAAERFQQEFSSELALAKCTPSLPGASRKRVVSHTIRALHRLKVLYRSDVEMVRRLEGCLSGHLRSTALGRSMNFRKNLKALM